jgi:small subunit ribosomal protein S12e
MGKQGMAAGIVDPALQQALENTLIYNGLPCGALRAAKVSDKGQAHLCVLASSCEKPVCKSSWWKPFVLSTKSH